MASTAPPRSLRIVAALALAWNLVGLAMFFMQVTLTPQDMAAMPEGQRAVYEATPAVLNVVFGIAVLAGLLGAVGLWLRKRWSVPLFLVSLLAIVVQMTLAYTMTPAWRVLGPAGAVLPVLLVVVAWALWWYARRAAGRDWL